MVAAWMINEQPMCSCSSDFEALEGPKVLFVPRRPVPMGSGGNTFLAR